ncbi:MAG: ATP-grasp fold amidoligase family protein [Treponemataceae bacterium]
MAYERNIQKIIPQAKTFPFVRVDWYEIKDKLFFGELTFYLGAGFEPFHPQKWDRKLGALLPLPKENIENRKKSFIKQLLKFK